MNKLTKVSALLFTSALLLAACGQDKKEEITVATTQAPTTQATTQATTTTQVTTTAPLQTTKAQQSDATEEQAVFEHIIGNTKSRVTITFKGEVIQKLTTDSIVDFDTSNLPEASKEAIKQVMQTQKDTLDKAYNEVKEQIQGMNGLKIDIRMEGNTYIQTYEVDYTIADFVKMKEISPEMGTMNEITNYDLMKEQLLNAGYKQIK